MEEIVYTMTICFVTMEQVVIMYNFFHSTTIQWRPTRYLASLGDRGKGSTGVRDNEVGVQLYYSLSISTKIYNGLFSVSKYFEVSYHFKRAVHFAKGLVDECIHLGNVYFKKIRGEIKGAVICAFFI